MADDPHLEHRQPQVDRGPWPGSGRRSRRWQEIDSAAEDAKTEDATTETPEEDFHPAYTPCLPNLPGDALNCGDLTSDRKPVTVNEIGVDPYRLDRDGDGRGCTS